MFKKKFIIFPLLFVLFAVLFLFSAYKVLSIKEEIKETELYYEGLAAVARSQNDKTVSNAERFKSLIELNQDFIAWLKIDGTNIDYPVMYNKDDPDKYLHTDFKGDYAISGTPYLGKGCDINSNSIIIYGHNTEDGTMFDDLLKYQNEAYYKEHPSFTFETINESFEYEIIAVYKGIIHNRDENNVFRYYECLGNLSKEEYDYYLSNIKDISLYPINKTANYDQQLITLSTCTDESKTVRMVIVGVRK